MGNPSISVQAALMDLRGDKKLRVPAERAYKKAARDTARLVKKADRIGCPKTKIAVASGLTRSQIYTILDT
jgi:hypothetical protein